MSFILPISVFWLVCFELRLLFLYLAYPLVLHFTGFPSSLSFLLILFAKVSFLFRSRCFFIPTHRFCEAQIRPALENLSHMWGGNSSVLPLLLYRVQRNAIRFIDDSSLTSTFQSLDYRRTVPSPSHFCRYYLSFCSSELSSTVPILVSQSSRTQKASHPYQVSVVYFAISIFPPQNSVFPLTYSLPLFKSTISKLVLT